MLQLLWPWMLAAVVAPFLVARLAPRAPDAAGAPIRVPYFEEAMTWSSRAKVSGARIRRAVALLAWCALILAAARPQWVGDPVSLPVRGRDLMLALDLSGSMREQDMKSRAGFEARIDVVKRVAGDFVPAAPEIASVSYCSAPVRTCRRRSRWISTPSPRWCPRRSWGWPASRPQSVTRSDSQ